MASNDDEAVGGEIYSLLFKHKVLTNNEIAGKLEKSPGCVHRCLDMLEKESLVRRIKVFGGNHKWQLNDGSENSSGYYSDLQDEDSVLSLKSIASSLDEIEDTSLTPVKQGPSLCQRGQQNSEPLSQTTYDVWSCPSCTFLNEQNMRTCKMCGTAKLEGSSLPDFREQTNLKSLQTHSLDVEETGQKLVNSENPIRGSSLPGSREQTNLKSLQTHSLDLEETSPKLVNSENPIRGSSLPGFREQKKSLQTHSLDLEETSPKLVNSENPIRDICTPIRLGEQTIPKCIQPPMLKKEVGGITLSTSSQITEMKMETVDPEIKPYLDILQTIVRFFSDPANKNLKPADVAKKCKIGQTKKDANNYLYHLEKKGVLKRTSDDGNKDPRWSAEPGALSAGIISIILNSLVIYVCFKQRNLLVASDYYIVNLAVSDLLLPVIGFPFAVTSSFGHKWNFGYPGCQAYGFIGFFCGVVSISTLTLMSFVRYVSVCRVELKFIVGQHTGVLIFGTYFYATLWAFPPIIGWGDYGIEPHGTSCTLKWNGNRIFVTFMLITCIILPVIIMNLCYGSIWSYLKKNTKYIAKWTSGRSMWKKREGYLIKITFTMCCAFMGTWTPYAVVSFWTAYGSEKTIPIRVTLTAILLAKLASIINPFIYFLMNRKFSPHVKAYLLKTFRSVQLNSEAQ